MIKILVDQDFNQTILRGLYQRVSNLDAVTAYEVGLSAASDTDLLLWAAVNERILLTHDRKTMPHHAADLMNAGQDVAGIFVVGRNLSIAQVIDDLELLVTCTEKDEWLDIVFSLPL